MKSDEITGKTIKKAHLVVNACEIWFTDGSKFLLTNSISTRCGAVVGMIPTLFPAKRKKVANG
jgi:hypothetical protein